MENKTLVQHKQEYDQVINTIIEQTLSNKNNYTPQQICYNKLRKQMNIWFGILLAFVVSGFDYQYLKNQQLINADELKSLSDQEIDDLIYFLINKVYNTKVLIGKEVRDYKIKISLQSFLKKTNKNIAKINKLKSIDEETLDKSKFKAFFISFKLLILLSKIKKLTKKIDYDDLYFTLEAIIEKRPI